MATQMTGQLNHNMQQCIQNCLDNYRLCIQTAQHCLGMGGDHASPEHQRTMLNAAEMSLTAATFMLRQDPLHVRTCAVCAEVSQRCADECERMANGSEQMLACAENSRKCAESCRQMAQSVA